MKLVFISTILLFACISDKPKDCDALVKQASASFEKYLYDRDTVSLEKTLKTVRLALSCDSTRISTYWLIMRAYSAKDEYDSALLIMRRFQKLSDGPDLHFHKGILFLKLDNADSARECFQGAEQRYRMLLEQDTTNSSLIMGRVQALVYLQGKNGALEELEKYKSRFPELKKELQTFGLLLDSL